MGLHGGLAHVGDANHTQRVHQVLFLELLMVVLGLVEVLLHVELLILLGCESISREDWVALRLSEVGRVHCVYFGVSFL